jgi:hypothetical protein
LQSEVLGAFARATDTTFLTGVPIMAAAFVLAWFVPVVALRTGNAQETDTTERETDLVEEEVQQLP